jgi:hypothetical protein
MLDLDRIKDARIGHLLLGDDKKYENEGTADGSASQKSQINSLADRLVNSASSDLSQLRSDLRGHETNLKSTVERLEQSIVAAGQSAEDVKLARQRRLDEVIRNYDVTQPESPIRRRKQEADAAYDRIFREVEGRPLRGGKFWIYMLLMACIAIVEWPVNRLAFAAFFQESPEFASALAFFVGVALALLAHFIGVLGKRVGHRDFQRSRRIRYWSGILFCLLFALLVIYTVTLARHAFLVLLAEANVSAVDLFRGAVQERIAESFFSPRFAIGDYALLVVNMLVLTIAIAFSFSHHDEHPDYASALAARERAARAFDKAKREYDRHYAETRAEFDSRWPEPMNSPV